MPDEILEQFYDRLMNDRDHPIAPASSSDPRTRSANRDLLNVFADADLYGTSIWSRAKRALVEVLQYAESLPRDHWFWTRPRAPSYLARLVLNERTGLPINPQDKRAWWFRIALDLYSGPNDFSIPAWRALRALGDFQVEWAIDAARDVELGSGVGTAEALAALAAELDVVDEARDVLMRNLDAYAVEEPAYRWYWVTRALRALDEQSWARRQEGTP